MATDVYIGGLGCVTALGKGVDSQLKKLKELETELAQYKRIVAEQTLQITVLKDVVEKKL